MNVRTHIIRTNVPYVHTEHVYDTHSSTFVHCMDDVRMYRYVRIAKSSYFIYTVDTWKGFFSLSLRLLTK